MRVLICGGRYYDDWETFRNVMHKIAIERFPRTEEDEYGNYLFCPTIIAGGAEGADRMAASWAMLEWCRYEEYKADWKKYGRAAGPIRNKQMLDEGKPSVVLAFPGGKGTANMIKLAKEAGVEVIEFDEEGNIRH